MSASPGVAILIAFGTFVISAVGREPSPAERAAAEAASGFESSRDWFQAALQWENAITGAEHTGDGDRAVAHAARAQHAWEQLPQSAHTWERQAFALGVISKYDLEEGRLVQGRQRNLQGLHLVESCLRQEGWEPKAGEPAPRNIPSEHLATWIRAQRDVASWLDLQGRTVEAVEVLAKAEASVAGIAATDSGTLRFYYRKSISTRGALLKFLGFEQRALDTLRNLEETRTPDLVDFEWAQRFNFAYFSSQVIGPLPTFLAAARSVLVEAEQSGRTTRDLRRVMAKMAYAYGEAGEDVRDLQGLIDEARKAGADLEAVYAHRDLLLLGAMRGNDDGVEEGLQKALYELRGRGVKRGEPTIYREYGQFLVRTGRPAEGLGMLREAIRMSRAFGWHQHLPALLASVCSAQARLGDIQGLTQTLRELDQLLSSGLLVPPREFLAHCARARTLAFLGRSREAEDAVRRAVAVADRVGLNEYQRYALEWTKGVEPAAVSSALAGSAQSQEGIIDLQPTAVVATPARGGTALARFRLSNATGTSSMGTLTADGRAVRLSANPEEGSAAIALGDQSGVESSSIPVNLGAGEDLIIDVESPAAEKESLRLTWKSGDQTLHATCDVQPMSGSTRVTPGIVVMNRSLAFENPFYAIHLHHPLRVDGTRSFRVLPSRRCRVEVLDARTGSVLAVDAEGDGAFSSLGDLIASDENSDHFPDFPADANGDGEIEVLIFPLAGAPPPGSETTVEIQTGSGDSWLTVAHDVLKSRRR